MAKLIIKSVADLKGLVGNHLGYSDYLTISQEQVNKFADATGDHQWIHIDVERAKAGPFGGPIAHGYLTLSLGPVFLPQIFGVEGIAMGVNYGTNKVRFPAPVPVGSKLRAGVKLLAVEDVTGGVQVTLETTFEVEGAKKPSCVAEVVFRYYLEFFARRAKRLSEVFHYFSKQFDCLSAWVVGTPRNKTAATEVDVLLHLLRDLFNCADKIVFLPVIKWIGSQT